MDLPSFKLEGSSAERQQRLSNLLQFVQKRSQEKREKELGRGEDDDQQKDIQEEETPTAAAAAAGSQPAKTKTKTTATKQRIPRQALLPRYQFAADTTIPTLDMKLRPDIEVRPYQAEALNAIVEPESMDQARSAQSGIIVLPCGAGKTLTSILVACAVQKPVLVVCSTIISAEQFQKEFLRFTTLMASKTGMFAGNKKWPFNGPAGVLFTTYTMLVDNKNRSADSKRMAQFINKTKWGVVILDEVHCVPAFNFSKAIAKIDTKVRLGLTATMLREDERIGDLEELVGPTLYHAKWKELADRGYIAKVICTQVECAMVPRVLKAYKELGGSNNNSGGSILGRTHHLKSLLSILNPKKMQLCQRLVQYHEARGDKVLVFCDHIDALKLYAEKLDRPCISGATPPDTARDLLKRFQIEVPKLKADASWSDLAKKRRLDVLAVNTLLLSRIGDTSLDLPAATVLIQVSSHFGSRRQEAQRLGRILRAKNRSEKGFYSRFYTLVTDDTHETAFSEKRRRFLEEDCGYGYQIWHVGDENTEVGGWEVTCTGDTLPPEDDDVQTEPITCNIQGDFRRPYETEGDHQVLVDFVLNIKNVQVEEDERETPEPTTAKRRKVAS
ncbi:component of the holoenzyme form of rnapolymerase transcription factor tfiih [Lichtheimia corymbifera JMRC:FSU:9682]|uniref:DNA 3'-5' helicase n=1 Tax=Lichtheimia corymbifera JMRC:FSU:9682 TaxID=1263082 RepID=A0A068REJ9_9FUNG|nr:component of the holoenzyme form of rnapolymerase transcription factor tfiih [Lichtheimia corymbifera JMRC:FSU:9682]